MIILRNFINNTLKEELKTYAHQLKQQGALTSNGKNSQRYCLTHYQHTAYATKTITDLEQRIRQLLTPADIKADLLLGWVISYIETGGFVHPHHDSNAAYFTSGRKHIRCNVVVSKPEHFGNPIIEDTVYAVDENDMWIFTASEEKHGSQPVVGETPRIIYQFGYSVNQPDDQHLINNIDQTKFT